MLHLHRLDDEQRGPRRHLVADRDLHHGHRARHGRGDDAVAGRALGVRGQPLLLAQRGHPPVGGQPHRAALVHEEVGHRQPVEAHGEPVAVPDARGPPPARRPRRCTSRRAGPAAQPHLDRLPAGGLQPPDRPRRLAQPPAVGHVPPVDDAAGRLALDQQRQRRPRRRRAAAAARAAVEVLAAPLDQPGVELPGDDVGVGEQRAQERRVRRHAEDGGVRRARRSSRARAVSRGRRPGDDLGQHRVVVGADDGAHGQRAVDADAGPGRLDAARARCRPAAGSRGPGPRRRPGPRSRARRGETSPWSSGSRSPAAIRSCCSTRSRPVTSSVTGCSTCSRVFISMKKNSSRPVGVDDELDRAGAGVADGLGRLDRGARPSTRADRGVEQRRRRLLDDLLVPALQAALALAEVDRRCRGRRPSTCTSMCRELPT